MSTVNVPYINTITGTTSSGATLSYANGSVAWTQPTNFYSSNQKALMTVPHGEEKVVLEEKATLEVKGSVKINGLDLEERLKTIERLLLIPERDAKMEAKYPSLKKKYDAYIKDLEKYRMWDSIKGGE